MNKDAAINQLAHITGCSRKDAIAVLKKMSKMSEAKFKSEKMSGKF